MFYAGLDYHTKRSFVSVLNEQGDEVCANSLESQTELAGFLANLPDDCQVLFEAGYGWPRLVRILEGAGVELKMCQPNRNSRIVMDRRKSDFRDARNLAVYLKSNTYREAWMPDESVRDERQLARRRVSLQREMVGIKLHIYSLLAYAGVPKEPGDIFAVKRRDYLESVGLPRLTRRTLDALLSVYDEIRDRVKELGVVIRELNKADPRARLLKTIPGIGDIAAGLLLAEIGEISRFRTPKSLSCYTGLTPGQHQSGDVLRMTGLTKEGCANMRWILIQAAWVAVRRDPALGQKFEELCREKADVVAICAIARQLAEIIWHILTKEVPYQAQKPKGKSQPVVACGKPSADGSPLMAAASPKM